MPRRPSSARRCCRPAITAMRVERGGAAVARAPKDKAKALMRRIDDVVKRADRGDEKALFITRGLMDGLPDLLDAYGNLAAAAEDALVGLYADRSVVTREALKRTLAEMRVELAGPQPSPLEKLLVERVVACWLQSYHADHAYARALKELPSKEVDLYQRRQDRAARQYLKAIRSLADVRRLIIPPMQLNLAENQVNITAAGPAVGSVPPDRVESGSS